MTSGHSALVERPESNVKPEDYIVRQVFFTARDGKRIAMFLRYRKDVHPYGHTPVMLYGYGGFGWMLIPGFGPEQLTWMDMGGIFAMPLLPGDDEYGEASHRTGMLENKPAVFDAYTDAAAAATGALVLLNVDFNAGHGGGSSRAQVVNTQIRKHNFSRQFF